MAQEQQKGSEWTEKEGCTGFKYDAGKERYGLIPALPLRELAKLFTSGAVEHPARNWEGGMDFERAYNALQRHAQAFWNGQDYDTDSKAHHMAAVTFWAFALMEMQFRGTGEDTRPYKENLNDA